MEIVPSSDPNLGYYSLVWILLGRWYIKVLPPPYSSLTPEGNTGEEAEVETSNLVLSDKKDYNDDNNERDNNEVILFLPPLTKTRVGGGYDPCRLHHTFRSP